MFLRAPPRGFEEMIEHFFTAPAACGGFPLPPIRGPPTPECGGGQVYEGKRNRVTIVPNKKRHLSISKDAVLSVNLLTKIIETLM